MLATRQAAWGSLAAPMRDGAGNSVLQSNQFLPGQRKAYLGGFEIPDKFFPVTFINTSHGQWL